MNVYFYSSFSKRTNSTKQPATTGSSFVVKDCKLKQDCSEHNPSFILSSDVYGYTYVYVPIWKKFYFVTDVISLANGLVEYQCAEDALATFRANVMSTSSGILYSSYGYDVMIPDPRIKTKNHRQIDFSIQTQGVFSGSYGYVLNVYSGTGDSTGLLSNPGGIVQSYLISPSGMSKASHWLGMTGVGRAISDYINGNLGDAVVSCIKIPYFSDAASLSSAISSDALVIAGRNSKVTDGVTFGSGELYQLNGSNIVIQKNFTISTNLRYTDFRAYEPYTFAALYLPGVGVVSISKNEFMGNVLAVASFIDVVTGELKYYLLSGAGGATIATYTTNVAATCPTGTMRTYGSGVLSGLTTTAAGVGALAATIASGGSGAIIAGAAFSTVSGISNTILSSAQHSPSVSGGFSNTLASHGRYIKYYEVSVDTQDPNDASYISLYGRPHPGNALLSTLIPSSPSYPTFVQTIDAHVNPEVSGSPVPNLREQTELNNSLNSGIYLE